VGSQGPAAETVNPWFLFARQYGIFAFWFVICIVFAVQTPAFFTKGNLTGIFEHTAIISMFAAGEAIVIIAALVDLSIAPIAAIAGIVAAKLLKGGMPPSVALVAGLGVGLVGGWINGFVTVRLQVSSLIATLGTFSAFTGIALIITGGYSIFGLDDLGWLGLSTIAGVETPAWIMLGLFGLLGLIMTSTVWGVRLLAVGGSVEGARRAGVRVDRYLWGAFIACSLCAALAGLVTFATLSTAEPVLGDRLIFDAITAVALAGVVLSGGRGSLPKVLVGALILGTIQNGLTLLNVPDYYQLVTTGVLLVTAVSVDGALSRAIERRRTAAPATTDPTTP
jgi:ribose transport system permease protein